MNNTEDSRLSLLKGLIKKARKAGADACDALFVEGVSLSHAERLGKPEHFQRSEGLNLGLRAFIGQRQAIASSSSISPEALDELTARVIAMARKAPEDPFCGLASPSQLAASFQDLDILDRREPSAKHLQDLARRAEDAARAVLGVANSEGARADWSRRAMTFAASNGFAKSYASTRHSISVAVLAGHGSSMETDNDFDTAIHGEDLRQPEDIGQTAGERAVKRLHPRKVKTAKVPAVYDPRVAGGIVSHLAMAINGAAIARGASFLKDKLGERIFPKDITIVDDPLRRRGLRSRPFDGEGIAPKRRNVVENGALATWILDLGSARQLGMETTGHASRGVSSPPSPAATNLYLEPGEPSPRELMAGIKRGLYVTELIGFGINAVNGDYSRGASGFWIENGEIAHPVSELTVAGNLNDMFLNLSAANDLEFRYGTNAPTLRIDGLMVAGSLLE